MEGNQTADNVNSPKPEDTSSFNLKWLLNTILIIWPWLLASIIISLVIGNLYLRYTTPVYRSYAEFLINDSKKGGGSDDVLQALKLSNNRINIDNEIEVLKSRSTMVNVIKHLPINIHYSIAGRFKSTELYSNKPFEFIIADSADDYYSCNVNVLGSDNYQILEGNGKIIPGKWGDTVSVALGKVVLKKTNSFNPDKQQYSVFISTVLDAANEYMHAIEISFPSKGASCIDLSMNDAIPERSVDLINKLMEIYMNNNVDSRTRVAVSTMDFIDKRISIVGEELTGVEKDIEAFKQNNDIADMKAQSSELITANAKTKQTLEDEELELEVMGSISDYLQKAEDNNLILPASMLANTGLSGMMDKYNGLTTAIENSEITNTSENPVTKALIIQKNELKSNIIASLASSKKEMQVKVDKIKDQLREINGNITNVPAIERTYLDFSRKQDIKQALYIFLLQKREETAIEKASTVPDAAVIDPAITVGQVQPNHSKILMTSLLLGLFIPFGVILIRRGLNIRIITKSDINKLTSIPIIGEIGNNSTNEGIVIDKNSRTRISEQFRALRTNLQFILTDNLHKTLMITSSMSNEGKSFIAVNLSITLAMSGKKVVLLEFDLRKPKISKKLGIDNSNGFSKYAIGKSNYEDIILPSGINENLYIISSGPIPPNPAELILLKRTEELFERLKTEFDYIIIDTSPIGLVTDPLLINKYVDDTLFIIRQGHTYKQQLSIPNELYTSGKIPKLYIILNDVIANRGFAYGYGYEENYGYGYGYGYSSYGNDYYIENNKAKGLKKWFGRKK